MAKKPTYPAITTEIEASKILGELENLKLKLEHQQVELNQSVNKLVIEANKQAEIVTGEFAEKFNALKDYARKNKQQLTQQGTVRSVTWATGTLGWRNTPAGISIPRSSKDVALIIERLLAAKKMKFLRRKWELNIEAMETSPTEAAAIDGINIRAASETIYIKFRNGDEIKQKIKLKTPSTTDVNDAE
ncbi:MAG: host-nuclease inhibitor Gam family protein [Patescibacteria group bacterium]